MTVQTLVEKVAGRIFVPLEASGRHVHVTAEQANILFGHVLLCTLPSKMLLLLELLASLRLRLRTVSE